jgi:hypothetical protein
MWMIVPSQSHSHNVRLENPIPLHMKAWPWNHLQCVMFWLLQMKYDLVANFSKDGHLFDM